MAFDKEKEIMGFAEGLLDAMAQQCLNEARKEFSVVRFPVVRKFLNCMVKRELRYYRAYYKLASVLVKTGRQATQHDLDELIEDSFELDTCLQKDMRLLPIWIHFDYDRILPLRRRRAEKQISYFSRLLAAKGGTDYYDLVRSAFSRKEFLSMHNKLVELYADETFLINSSVKSFFDVQGEEIARKMHRLVLHIGITMSRETADLVYGSGTDTV